jgi:hypothetical protein
VVYDVNIRTKTIKVDMLEEFESEGTTREKMLEREKSMKPTTMRMRSHVMSIGSLK